MEKIIVLTHFDPMTPPSVIHGWKATDLLFLMVKWRNDFLNPISRQNFANALTETPNLNLEVRHNYFNTDIFAIYQFLNHLPKSSAIITSLTSKKGR